MTATTSPTTYCQVPYPSYAFAQTHPDHMWSIARLFGMRGVDPQGARVLEIGCASGGNILPMASQLPGASFLGIDLSTRQIEEGLRSIAATKLSNVQLQTLNLNDVPESWEPFDYIICHGVFSWVSTELQHRILRICSQHLSENGLAYISYNTYPGWYMRGMIREMMRYHVRALDEPAVQVLQSRALLGFLSECTNSLDTAYAKFLKQELGVLAKQSDSYLFHEHLEKHNLPLFFHQFARMAWECDLQYLGEANLPSMWLGNLPGQASAVLEKLTSEILQREQYADFVCNRAFRQTILCKKGVAIDRSISETRLSESNFFGHFQDKTGQRQWNAASNEKIQLVGFQGQSIETTEPALKMILLQLNQAWPKSVTFDKIAAGLTQLFGFTGIAEPATIAAVRSRTASAIGHLLVKGVIGFSFSPDRFTLEPQERPLAHPYARWQALHDKLATNFRHQLVKLDVLNAKILALLDGSRDYEQLVNHIQQAISAGELVIQSEPNANRDPEDVVRSSVSAALQSLRKNLFLQPTGVHSMPSTLEPK